MKHILFLLLLSSIGYSQEVSASRFWSRTDTATTTWTRITLGNTNRSSFFLDIFNAGSGDLYATTNADTTALDSDGVSRIIVLATNESASLENITVPWIWVKARSGTAIYKINKW